MFTRCNCDQDMALCVGPAPQNDPSKQKNGSITKASDMGEKRHFVS